MASAYIVGAKRTPIGAFLGGLQSLSAPDLAASVMQELLTNSPVADHPIDEVILGQVIQAGTGQAPARQAALKANLSPQTSALTVNMVCGSGLRAVMLADQAVRAGDSSFVVAGGMESMSQAPFGSFEMRRGRKMGDASLVDLMLHDGLTCATEQRPMGDHAEHTAKQCQLSRADQDAYAVRSQQRAESAIGQGVFRDELVPITVPGRKADVVVAEDECPRSGTTLDKLATLRPAFQSDGTVTAGNASTLSDGAAACLVVNEPLSTRFDWRFRIRSCAISGLVPRDLFIAPIESTREAVKKAGLTIDDIDLFEINEAFASQALACVQGLDVDTDRVNIHGGAIALGHPIGASGARVLVTLCHSLLRHQKTLGVASLCLGGGNAVSMVIEAC